MIVTCSTCSQAFEDIDHWTMCPHDWFPPGWFVSRVLSGDALVAQYVDRMAAAIVEADHLAWWLRVGEPELARAALSRLDGRMGALIKPTADTEPVGGLGTGEVPGLAGDDDVGGPAG